MKKQQTKKWRLFWIILIHIGCLIIGFLKNQILDIINEINVNECIRIIKKIFSIDDLSAFLIIGCIYYLSRLHKWDRKDNLYGIGGLYAKIQDQRKTKKPLHRVDSNFIPGYLTKQSIFAAICIAIIAYIMQSNNKTPFTEKCFIIFPYANLIVILLLISLICSLISILCYDYSYRFQWNHGITISLLVQGLKFDTFSFYLLIASLLLTVSVFSAPLAIILNFIFLYCLKQYYFFDKNLWIFNKEKRNIYFDSDTIEVENINAKITINFLDNKKKQETLEVLNNYNDNYNLAKELTYGIKRLNLVLKLEITNHSEGSFLFKQKNIEIDFCEDTLYLSYLDENNKDNTNSWSILLDSIVEFTNEIYAIFGVEECLNYQIEQIFSENANPEETNKLYLLFISNIDTGMKIPKMKIEFLP